MYVKDHMTVNPTCITKETSVSKALDIMEQNNFHRLPVVNENQELIGLVTEGLIAESSGASTTSLSIYELNYLLSRTKVHEIMIRDVVTIDPDSLIEEAAHKMKQNHVNALPVIDDKKHVIGIITENDIFEAIIDLLGYNASGTRFVVNVKEDVPGVLVQLATLFANKGHNVLNLGVYHNERGTEVVILAASDCPEMKDVLQENGWNVTDVRKQTKA